MSRLLAVCAVAAMVAAASAAITPIGQFTGTYQEGWEKHATGQFLPQLTAFDGHATANQVGSGQGLHVTSGWAYYYTTYPHGGSKFMGPTYGIGVRWEFEVPALRFGGFFTTNYQSSGATAKFFDAQNNLLATLPVKAMAGNNAWGWDGWECDPPVKYVEIWSDWGAGHIMHDDLEYTPVPEPASLSLLSLVLLLRRR